MNEKLRRISEMELDELKKFCAKRKGSALELAFSMSLLKCIEYGKTNDICMILEKVLGSEDQTREITFNYINPKSEMVDGNAKSS